MPNAAIKGFAYDDRVRHRRWYWVGSRHNIGAWERSIFKDWLSFRPVLTNRPLPVYN